MVSPPLVVTREEIDEIARILADAIAEVAADPAGAS
jgi:adenosylmethionine-8-amino-7-oxononanoate aminotransferase